MVGKTLSYYKVIEKIGQSRNFQDRFFFMRIGPKKEVGR